LAAQVAQKGNASLSVVERIWAQASAKAARLGHTPSPVCVQKKDCGGRSMSDEQVFKGFRPSRMAGNDELDDDLRIEKEAKMVQYQIRAQAGLPLFDGPLGTLAIRIHKKSR
jgi:hypothetical protein